MKSYLKIFTILIFILIQFSIFTQSYGEQQFSYLSKSFLNGRLDLNNYPYSNDDLAIYNGNKFWPLGPFPAIVISPLVFLASFLNTIFLHKYIHWIFVLGVFYLTYKISVKLGYNKKDSLMWALAFNLGSVFIGVSFIPWSWYFAQVICTFLIFLALFNYLSKRNYFYIGLIYSFVLLTRTTAFLGLIFYLITIVTDKNRAKDKLKNYKKLLLPILVAIILLAGYNYLRFGNIFEQGYQYQIVSEKQEAAREYGLITFKHIPGNLYYFLIAPPQQVFKDAQSKVLRFPYLTFGTWGLGIFFTSFYFIKLLFISYKRKIVKYLLLTSLIISIPIFMFYGVGYTQYGYRYSLDFLPFLFLILMLHFRKRRLSMKFKLAIIFSVFLNSYLILSMKFV